jgi:hypothetical protein
VVFRDDGPTVREQLHLALAGVDHRLDCHGHARNELEARAGLAVVQHLRVFVKFFTDTVSAIFAHDGETVRLGMFLDRVTDVAQFGPGS